MDGTTAQAIEHSIIESEKVTQVGFKRLTDGAIIPTKAFTTDSGFDLYASEDIVVEPRATVVIPTDIAVMLPEGFAADVRPRSGITSRTKLRIQYGTIDNGYTSGIGVIADNIAVEERRATYAYTLNGNDTELGLEVSYPSYLIRKGDKLAQLVITRLPDVEAVEVFDVGESERGDSGFGSSGVSAL